MLVGGVPLDWQCDPLDVLGRWPADRGVYLLHSARPDARWSRYSVIAEPVESLRHHRGQTRLNQADSALARSVKLSHRPLTDLRRVLDADAGRSLWLGYLGYDLARAIESLPEYASDDRGWPDFQLERCDGWLVHDNHHNTWAAHGTYAIQPPRLLSPHAYAEPAPVGEASGTALPFTAGPIRPDQPRASIERSVQRVIDYIAAGDVFQANLAQRFSGPFTGDTRRFYAALAEHSPAWYGVYGELTRFDPGEPRRTLASISPELFLDCDAQGSVTTRPIKGTRPSSVSADELRDSSKDRAELAMIVDLMRNDLGRVCSYGSIRVTDPRTIESHPTIHHGVATIQGKLHPSRDLVDLLTATLPGGSITGAPKVRAMQVIEQLEPSRRGPYCGAIGMIRGGQARLNIAIRTVLIQQPGRGGTGCADVWAGGGITADSVPRDEYQEMLDKADAMRRVLTGQAIKRCGVTDADASAPAAPRG